jgi:hypothetical protein
MDIFAVYYTSQKNWRMSRARKKFTEMIRDLRKMRDDEAQGIAPIPPARALAKLQMSFASIRSLKEAFSISRMSLKRGNSTCSTKSDDTFGAELVQMGGQEHLAFKVLNKWKKKSTNVFPAPRSENNIARSHSHRDMLGITQLTSNKVTPLENDNNGSGGGHHISDSRCRGDICQCACDHDDSTYDNHIESSLREAKYSEEECRADNADNVIHHSNCSSDNEANCDDNRGTTTIENNKNEVECHEDELSNGFSDIEKLNVEGEKNVVANENEVGARGQNAGEMGNSGDNIIPPKCKNFLTPECNDGDITYCFQHNFSAKEIPIIVPDKVTFQRVVVSELDYPQQPRHVVVKKSHEQIRQENQKVHMQSLHLTKQKRLLEDKLFSVKMEAVDAKTAIRLFKMQLEADKGLVITPQDLLPIRGEHAVYQRAVRERRELTHEVEKLQSRISSLQSALQRET